MENLEQRVDVSRWEGFKDSAKRVALGVFLSASLLSGIAAGYLAYTGKVINVPQSPFEYRLEYRKEVLPNGIILEEKNEYERSAKIRIEIAVPDELKGKNNPMYREL